MKSLMVVFFVLNALIGNAQSALLLGFGYSGAEVKAKEYYDFFTAVNDANTGLTSKFSTNQMHHGYNIFIGSKSEKSSLLFSFSQIWSKSTAEGVIPVVSSNAGKFEISDHHSCVSMIYDYYLISFFGIGGQFGFNYSTIRNRQDELAFGDSKSVVDKKGGLIAGFNLVFHIPLGEAAFIQLQPSYDFAFYKMDMDNIAAIYLGQDNTAAGKSSMKNLGLQARFGISIN